MKKILFTVSALLVGMLLFGTDTHAYIDPSVTTYLIQVIAGVVIAIGAFVGLYYRKAKKKVTKAFGIDENKNKVVESDDIKIIEDNKEE